MVLCPKFAPMKASVLEKRIFTHHRQSDFESTALAVFRFQYENVPVYRQFCKAINRLPNKVNALEEIPFLPIQFFKSHQILVKGAKVEEIFTSSGTTGNKTSKHHVHRLALYKKTFRHGFESFYGSLDDYAVLALLPSYLERKGSSLIYMAQDFIAQSGHPESGFYLHDYDQLSHQLRKLDKSGQKVLLLGVSFALLELVERESFRLKNTIVMETGGMKGRRKEMTRNELHQRLCQGFGVHKIHSEYGMTELLSQAYSKGNGLFQGTPTLQVLTREPEDPFAIRTNGKTGGLNIIDLANLYSCAFIATQDLGKMHPNHHFEILGRFDHSDIRGCNLMVVEN